MISANQLVDSEDRELKIEDWGWRINNRRYRGWKIDPQSSIVDRRFGALVVFDPQSSIFDLHLGGMGRADH